MAEGHALDENISRLIQAITMVVPAMDDLRQMKLLTDEQYDLVKYKDTTQEQMRELYRHVKSWGNTDKTTVYQCLKLNNPLVVANVERSLQSINNWSDHDHEAPMADSNHSVRRKQNVQSSMDQKLGAETEEKVMMGLQECVFHERALRYDCTENKNQHLQTEEKCNLHQVLEEQNDQLQQRVQDLHEDMEAEKAKAEDITRRMSILFSNSRSQLNLLEERILSEISRQEEQASMSVSDLIQKLEVKKEKLCRDLHPMQELRTSNGPLQEMEYDACTDPRAEARLCAVRNVDMGLISAMLHSGLSDMITGIKRGIYEQEITDLLLDINTAENHVHISDDLKTATWSQRDLQRPDSEERFNYSQVLSRSGVSTQQGYWEVETSGTGAWRVGMSYASVVRKGRQSSIGNNDRSWALCRWINGLEYGAIHNRRTTPINDKISTQRFGIYLDYETGRLSFYELSDPVKHLHTFYATFMEPLHAAIYVWDRDCDKGCWVRIRSYEK
ncbi:uncharacterized protein ACNLHF_014771 isoform 1-T1 [Anomaloglossus baeobatrachus]|uniref:uncharacterized protein LOC142300928 isoform X1 n=2 Tax=Anomaloglossus baeobatrachus TaxID=238106 RepID=UPI003F50A46D